MHNHQIILTCRYRSTMTALYDRVMLSTSTSMFLVYIILNCELVLITWRQSAKRYDPQEWSSDYQRLKSAGLEEMYTRLPILQ